MEEEKTSSSSLNDPKNIIFKTLSSKELGCQNQDPSDVECDIKEKLYTDIYKSFSYVNKLLLKKPYLNSVLLENVNTNSKPPHQHYSRITPETYWTSLSYPNSQCSKRPISTQDEFDALSNDESLTTIVAAVTCQNIHFFESFETKIPRTSVWNLDGVSGCGKSSTFQDIKKSNIHMKCIGQNTHPGAHMGYLITSMKMMTASDPGAIWDRTPYNNTLWFSIWEIISHVKNNYESYNKDNSSNTYCDTLLMDGTQKKFLGNRVLTDSQLLYWKICMTETRNDTYGWLSANAKTILVVDSFESGSTKRLSCRNKGSDKERSDWLHYIRAQNFAYMYLATNFPEDYCIIDLNYLNGNQTLMQKIIRRITDRYKIDKTNPLTFTPLKPATVKPLLTPMAEQYERTRNYQQLKFTKNMKYLAKK